MKSIVNKALCIITTIAGIGLATQASALTMLDFENPQSVGLSAIPYWQGSALPDSAKVNRHFADLGIVAENTVLLDGGVGHAASGRYMIGGIGSKGFLDYDAPMRFTFVSTKDGNSPMLTDFFSINTDRAGGSGNSITLYGYAVDGSLIGKVTQVEGGGNDHLELAGLGLFHSVVVDPSLSNPSTGGIGFDMLTFGDLQAFIPSNKVPEPSILSLAALGLLGLGHLRRNRT
ncbi:PEP-CTERM sorting domain-containing protein [Chitinivorax sp. B]|uniref:PEP-CTERM sorting domain-containing protein n=1 Tax=Chitinivorax sp. B TaxID=2502235 RepID=UPI0010F6EF4A|nr:PEP-CTERM sorting domain-containing protein [Chitinivorax sp. B]